MKKSWAIPLLFVFISFCGCNEDDNIEIRKTTQAYIFIPAAVSKQIRLVLATKNLHYSANSKSWEGEGDLVEFNLLSLEDNSLVAVNYAINIPPAPPIESAFIAVKFNAAKDVLTDKQRPATSGYLSIVAGTPIVEPTDILTFDYLLVVDGKELKSHYVGWVTFIYES
jgi:hypothetical protein